MVAMERAGDRDGAERLDPQSPQKSASADRHALHFTHILVAERE